MFEVDVKVETLRSVFSILTPIVGEVKLKADEEGWKIKAVDPAHVAMVDLSLSKDAFDRYDIEPMELGLNVERLLEHLKGGKADEMVLLKLDSDNRLVAESRNAAGPQAPKDFWFSPRQPPPPPPPLEYPETEYNDER
ncbi:MAG: hypothetical protein ACMUHY_04150, partial [Thermoplasmatota archaeon]